MNALSKLTFAAFVCFAGHCRAGQAMIGWTASPDDWRTNGMTYVLHSHTNPIVEGSPVLVKLNVGTNLSALVTFTNAGRWFFRVAAVNTDGVASELSNELLVQSPRPATELRTVAIEHTINLPGGFTNVGFFRLSFER